MGHRWGHYTMKAHEMDQEMKRKQMERETRGRRVTERRGHVGGQDKQNGRWLPRDVMYVACSRRWRGAEKYSAQKKKSVWLVRSNGWSPSQILIKTFPRSFSSFFFPSRTVRHLLFPSVGQFIHSLLAIAFSLLNFLISFFILTLFRVPFHNVWNPACRSLHSASSSRRSSASRSP